MDLRECRHGEEGAAADHGLCSACSWERAVSEVTRARMNLGTALVADAELAAEPARAYLDGDLVAEVRTTPDGRPTVLLVRLP